MGSGGPAIRVIRRAFAGCRKVESERRVLGSCSGSMGTASIAKRGQPRCSTTQVRQGGPSLRSGWWGCRSRPGEAPPGARSGPWASRGCSEPDRPTTEEQTETRPSREAGAREGGHRSTEEGRRGVTHPAHGDRPSSSFTSSPRTIAERPSPNVSPASHISSMSM